MLHRLVCFVLIAGLALGAPGPLPLAAADAPQAGLDGAVGRGLDYLADQQNPDGSFGSNQKIAVTGLSLMAFLAAGHVPNTQSVAPPNIGRFGGNVRSAIDYLLDHVHADGSFDRFDKPMYGQAIATLALAEAYGVDTNLTQRKRTAAALAASVRLILAAQDVPKQEAYVGGWRYESGAGDSDLSLSGWNVLALRACRDVGIAVPQSAVSRATRFVMHCWDAQGRGFSYQPGGSASAPMTGVGLVCLHVMAAAGDGHAEEAARTLSQHPMDDAPQYPYYALYYATQGAMQAGDPFWQQISRATLARLLAMQEADGAWPDNPGESAGAGRVYCTSMAVLTLCITYRLLPAYQR